MAPPANLMKIAEDVVRRARAGDQNAMGLIAETRESSLHPEGQRARDMMKAIFTYCKKNPVPETEPAFPDDDTVFGEETTQSLGKLKSVVNLNKKAPSVKHDKGCLKETLICLNELALDPNNEAAKVAAIILANGPALIPPRLEFMKSLIADPQAQAVFHATVIGSLGEVPTQVRANNADAIHVGKVVGRARVMQMVRNSMHAIKLWCSRTHAEIGLDDDEEISDDGGFDVDSSEDTADGDGSEVDNGDYQQDGQASTSPQQDSGGGGGGGSGPSSPQDSGSGASAPEKSAPPDQKMKKGSPVEASKFVAPGAKPKSTVKVPMVHPLTGAPLAAILSHPSAPAPVSHPVMHPPHRPVMHVSRAGARSILHR